MEDKSFYTGNGILLLINNIAVFMAGEHNSEFDDPICMIGILASIGISIWLYANLLDYKETLEGKK